jgi:2-dehydro-3-deoxyphosphogluconate aldolase/(4S)-4-hydroxy-2-oxoglutarate aldolase
MLPKVHLLKKVVDSGIIAVVPSVPHDRLIHVVAALVNNGVSVLEISIDNPGAFSSINRLSNLLKGQAIIGAGSIIDSEAAKLAIDSGADFIVSPCVRQDVIEITAGTGKISIPAAATLREIVAAKEWGADFVRVAPDKGKGWEFIKDIDSSIPVITKTGKYITNKDYIISDGVVAIRLDTKFIDKQEIEVPNLKKINHMAQHIAQQYVSIVKGASQIPNIASY